MALAVLMAVTVLVPGSTPRAEAAPVGAANVRFIVDTYGQLLDREPDELGIQFHLDRLAAGGDRTRTAFVYGLLFSTEGAGRDVARLYGDVLDRRPDSQGAAYWTDHLRGRTTVELRILLLASDEFHRRSGATDASWLAAVYRQLLGREIDQVGRVYWTQLLDAGVPRTLVVAGIGLSPEAIRGRAVAAYREILDRDPNARELAAALAVVTSAGERTLRAQLWGSDEYFERYLIEAAP